MSQVQQAAIVTGASRGIGRAVTARLARDGFNVVVNYAGNQAEAAKAVAEIESAGGHAIAMRADVAKTEDVVRLFDEAEKAFGGVDVLVNSAGIMAMRPIAEFEDEMFDRIFTINVRGTFNTLKQAAKRIRNGGRVINFSSSVLALGMPGYGPYSATKAAIEALSKVLANEFSREKCCGEYGRARTCSHRVVPRRQNSGAGGPSGEAESV